MDFYSSSPKFSNYQLMNGVSETLESYHVPQNYYKEDPTWKKNLSPGIKFRPTDQELIINYLTVRALDGNIPTGLVSEVNIYQHEPQDLHFSAYDHGDGRMYFFSPLKRKDNSKKKSERLVSTKGFWKATQKREEVRDNKNPSEIIGTKTSLTYHTYLGNIADRGTKKLSKKEPWLMTEYRLPSKFYDCSTASEEEWALCVIYYHQTGKKDRENDTALPIY